MNHPADAANFFFNLSVVVPLCRCGSPWFVFTATAQRHDEESKSKLGTPAATYA
jgi:hypothetical protein